MNGEISKEGNGQPRPAGGPPIRDALSRPLRDLRISVTDRCNFRCTYCMPKEVFGPDFAFLPRKELLTFEEIAKLAGIFAAHGVNKIRLTGGEPLLRTGLEKLVEMLARTDGIDDIALTTNGSLLTREKARRLREAGLRRVTVSLDSLDDAVFMKLNDVNFPVSKVLEAVENAAEAGFPGVKINMVVKRGANEDSILPMAEHFRGTGHTVRFIEFMDVGNSNGWRMDQVVAAREILARIGEKWPIEPLPKKTPGEVARRFRYLDGAGEIGVIASVTEPFCGGCSRVRLSSEGLLYTCLFGTQGVDFRAVLRSGGSDGEIGETLRALWTRRQDRYSELRAAHTRPPASPKVEMSHIGG